MSDERRYYAPLLDLISKDELYAAVFGIEKLQNAVDMFSGDFAIPTASLDTYARQSCAQAGLRALPHLSDVELVSHNKDISGEIGEKLQPDMLLYCRATNAFVLLEVKDDRNATREALTETYAYDHEIKTRFPFLASSSVIHVIISSHWPTLLKHSITGACAWEGKTILCLTPTIDSTGSIRLTIELPAEWEQIFAESLADDAILATPMLLLPKRDYGLSTGDRLLNVAQLCAIRGRELGTHGFAMLCTRIKENNGSVQCMDCVWVSLLNPYAFRIDRDNITSDKLREIAVEARNQSLILKELLSSVASSVSHDFDAHVQHGERHWRLRRHDSIAATELPHKFTTWGLFEELVINTYVSQGARFLRSIDHPEWDATVNSVKLVVPLIDEFCGSRPFGGAELSSDALYRFGLHLGVARDGATLGDATTFMVFREWNFLTLIPELRELATLLRGAAVTYPSTPDLTMPSDSQLAEQFCIRTIAWCLENLFPDAPMIRLFFDLGQTIGMAALFDPKNPFFSSDERRSSIIGRISAVVLEARKQGDTMTLVDTLDASQTKATKDLITCVDGVATASAGVIAPLRIAVANARYNIDIDGARENLMRLRSKFPSITYGIIKNAFGGLYIGPVDAPLPRSIALDSEVACRNLQSGTDWTILPWESVTSGDW